MFIALLYFIQSKNVQFHGLQRAKNYAMVPIKGYFKATDDKPEVFVNKKIQGEKLKFFVNSTHPLHTPNWIITNESRMLIINIMLINILIKCRTINLFVVLIIHSLARTQLSN